MVGSSTCVGKFCKPKQILEHSELRRKLQNCVHLSLTTRNRFKVKAICFEIGQLYWQCKKIGAESDKFCCKTLVVSDLALGFILYKIYNSAQMWFCAEEFILFVICHLKGKISICAKSIISLHVYRLTFYVQM